MICSSLFFRIAVLAQLFLCLAAASACAEGTIRSCAVKEVLKGGIYVYIRCQENAKDVWLATVAREFKTDENISFLDVPPMNDFYSKHLDRVFPEVIFTELLPSGATRK